MGVPRILHYPGSKWSMAEWIISHMPPHTTYLEPFFGSGAVFFNKPPSALETINDIDGNIVNLFRIIRDRPDELSRAIQLTPFSRQEYYASDDPTEDELEKARRFMVRCWMSQGGKLCGRTGWRSVMNARDPQPAQQWVDVPNRVLVVTERLAGVQIECQTALQLLERYKLPEVLVFADPPYVMETRTGSIYRHEMNTEDHIQLLEALDAHPGPVLLSGYASRLYDDRLRHWTREVRSALAQRGKVTEEVLWINPIAAESIGRQLTLF
ncbi:DNA adenine methylase [Paenibacillus ehimensis]|uniref:DNA adenine methylase n=1 Tax=Paenibacillus ehimensis TaxID=79264 RepID=A0ABT8VMH3_9BACL|nr:DNA adenine methylase [Paenibacillus ehimensis]MDO3682179.1 DNA adenine methylase [Paenibacillus ehimensis]